MHAFPTLQKMWAKTQLAKLVSFLKNDLKMDLRCSHQMILLQCDQQKTICMLFFLFLSDCIKNAGTHPRL